MRSRFVPYFVDGVRLETGVWRRARAKGRPLWTLQRTMGTSKPSRTQSITSRVCTSMDERMKEWINATRFKGRIKFHVTYYSAYRYCLGGGLIHRASRDCRDCSRDFRRGVRFGRNSYHHHSIPRFPIPGTSCCGRPAILPSRCPFPFTRRLYHYATSSGGTKRAGCGATVPPAVAKVIANPLTPIPDPLCSLAPYKARLTICNWVHDPS